MSSTASGVDLTVQAEALIGAVARAFYDDDAVCLIDVLLRDKFLRDDDMGPRLSLPAKQLRRTLQFLEEEHIVRHELVDDLSDGGSQNTKFWYIDYSHTVHVIRLRVFLLKKKLEQAELRARSSSVYLCPGYKTKACNGKYTEEEAQQVVDPATGRFLCRECVEAHQNNPDPPSSETYTLRLVDNTRDLRLAMDNVRRVTVQLSAKMDGGRQVRPGVFDLLQKVRVRGSGPLTSNLPSENRSMGIGSTRIAGTGRTAGIKAKKLAQRGVLPGGGHGGVGGGGGGGPGGGPTGHGGGGGRRGQEDGYLTYLKNAVGQELAFEVERGGGARANLLATRGRRREKLLDAAASRVGVDPGIVARVQKAEEDQRRRLRRKRDGDEAGEEAEEEVGGADAGTEGTKAKKKKTRRAEAGSTKAITLSFLRNNIGRADFEEVEERERQRRLERLEDEEGEDDDTDDDEGAATVPDETEELHAMTEEERRATFQSQYKAEMARQRTLLFPRRKVGDGVVPLVAGGEVTAPPNLISSDDNGIDDGDGEGVNLAWEDG